MRVSFLPHQPSVLSSLISFGQASISPRTGRGRLYPLPLLQHGLPLIGCLAYDRQGVNGSLQLLGQRAIDQAVARHGALDIAESFTDNNHFKVRLGSFRNIVAVGLVDDFEMGRLKGLANVSFYGSLDRELGCVRSNHGSYCKMSSGRQTVATQYC